MNSVHQAELYFVMFADELGEFAGQPPAEAGADEFISLLIDVQNDEYTAEFAAAIDRRHVFKDEIQFRGHRLPCSVIVNNFTQYDASSVYLRLSIDSREGLPIEDFVYLIAGTHVLDGSRVNGGSLRETLTSIGITIKNRTFLFTQLRAAHPEIPKSYDGGLKYIEDHEQRFHQLLLRSNTHHEHLRVDNHTRNFDSIANFYGTIDLCSPIHLLQVYQHPIRSVSAERIYGAQHRACWWLTITDVIFIQQQILQRVVARIENLEVKDKQKFMARLADLEEIVINMKGFWHFEHMVHEISKAVINAVKSRVGLDEEMKNVQDRIKSIEYRTMRELNRVQNEQNDVLNVILVILAGLQIIPIVYQALDYFYDPSQVLQTPLVLKWIQALSITILIPLIFWKRNSIARTLSFDRNRRDLA